MHWSITKLMLDKRASKRIKYMGSYFLTVLYYFFLDTTSTVGTENNILIFFTAFCSDKTRADNLSIFINDIISIFY